MMYRVTRSTIPLLLLFSVYVYANGPNIYDLINGHLTSTKGVLLQSTNVLEDPPNGPFIHTDLYPQTGINYFDMGLSSHKMKCMFHYHLNSNIMLFENDDTPFMAAYTQNKYIYLYIYIYIYIYIYSIYIYLLYKLYM
eukprot:GHVR01020631.1.p1 GENE.GHVR01020631.1~~GHVR01020631.1.p1  ORF type:complete len:138 (+),score=12.45 GHVR01020631.1:58-471(+)